MIHILQKLGIAGMQQMRKEKMVGDMQNRTVKALRDAKRNDLADAVESGLLGATDAAKILFAKPDAYKAASPVGKLAADLQAGVINEEQYKKGLEDLVKSGVNVELSNEGAIPAGYQAIRDDNGKIIRIEPYQGSKPAEASVKSAEQGARAGNIVIQDIERLKKNVMSQDIFNPTTGALGWIASFIPSSGRVDAENLGRTIKANIGFDRLQQMREASPTGGALGSVSDRELRNLQSVMGSIELSQSEDQLLDNLERLGDIYSNIMRVFSAYPNAEDYGLSSAGVSLEEDPLKLFK